MDLHIPENIFALFHFDCTKTICVISVTVASLAPKQLHDYTCTIAPVQYNGYNPEEYAGIILYITSCNQYRLVDITQPANKRQHYIVTSLLIGWAHTQNDSWVNRPATNTAKQ